MKNLKLFTISILLVQLDVLAAQLQKKDTQQNKHEVANKENYHERNFIKRMRQMHENFEREMEELFSAHDKMYDDLFNESTNSDKKFNTTLKININKETEKDNSEWVVITIDLPDAGKKYSDIKIKAKGTNLEGNVDYNNHKLNFFVFNGREFGTSIEYHNESEENKTDKEQKYKKVMMSSSSQISTIPVVASLEKTKVSTKDNKLVIKLPSAVSKQDWSTIKVDDSPSENLK